MDCRDLIGYDLRAPGGHEAFIASGIWRDGCLRQVEWVVGRLAGLADKGAWEEAVQAIEAADAARDDEPEEQVETGPDALAGDGTPRRS